MAAEHGHEGGGLKQKAKEVWHGIKEITPGTKVGSSAVLGLVHVPYLSPVNISGRDARLRGGWLPWLPCFVLHPATAGVTTLVATTLTHCIGAPHRVWNGYGAGRLPQPDGQALAAAMGPHEEAAHRAEGQQARVATLQHIAAMHPARTPLVALAQRLYILCLILNVNCSNLAATSGNCPASVGTSGAAPR